MSLLEPLPRANSRATRTANPYEGRWRWWYSAIADEMLKDPSISASEIAKNIKRGATTVGCIIATDLFKEYFAQRRSEFTRKHDEAIRNKLLGLTEKALDNITNQLEKKKDQVPIGMVKDIAMEALEKLGYGAPAGGPQVAVQVNNGPQQHVVVAASLSELEQARAALRAAGARGPAPPVVELLEPAGAEEELGGSDAPL